MQYFALSTRYSIFAELTLTGKYYLLFELNLYYN